MLKIDFEFRDLIPPLTAEEYSGLEESILRDGCRDALVVWGETIVDGHNRYEICKKHDLPYQIVQKEFDDRDSVKLWMMRNQLSRRNLSDFQRIEIVRKCEDAVKAKARERMTAGVANPVEIFPEGKRARDELGEMAGVSGKTYERAVAVMETAPAQIIEATRKNGLTINSAYQVTKMEPEEQEEIALRIENGEIPREVVHEVQKRPHVSYNSGNNEWYTPSDIIEMARSVMGSIDLDPASSIEANNVVKATRIFDIVINGLEQEWSGNVWLNPPYGTESVGKFVDKLLEELPNIQQAIVLVNNATETEWFGKLVEFTKAMCFPKGRIRYWVPGEKTGSPLQGQALFYYGDNRDKFIEVFREKGWCVIPA